MREQAEVDAQALTRAQAGDGEAFGRLTAPYRHELRVRNPRRPRRCRSPPGEVKRSGSSPTPTCCSTGCRTKHPDPRRGTRSKNRSRWPSSQPCSSFRPDSARRWCYETFSAFAPRKWPISWTAAMTPSPAHSRGQGPHSPKDCPLAANRHRCLAPPANTHCSPTSSTPSSEVTSTAPYVPAGADPREQPTGIRLLPPGLAGSDRPRPRTDRADPRGQPDLRLYRVPRQERPSLLRPTADALSHPAQPYLHDASEVASVMQVTARAATGGTAA
jgi:hypothetical protein